MTRFFLDTSVLVSAVAGRSRRAAGLVFSGGGGLVTSEYALKELRRVLLRGFGLSQAEAGDAVDEVRRHCTVLPSPGKEACRKIVLDDRSDAPIVAGALQAGAVLLSYDRKLLAQAKKYVRTATP